MNKRSVKNCLLRLVGIKREPKTRHIWKEVRRETLGSFLDFGMQPQDITRMYRVAVHEECLLTNEKRIREVQSLWRGEDDSFSPANK